MVNYTSQSVLASLFIFLNYLIINCKRIICNLIRREHPAEGWLAGPIIIFRCHPPHLEHSELNVFPSGARDSFYIYLI